MLPKPCNKTRTSWTMSARTIGLAVIWFGRHPERAWFAQRRIQRSSRENGIVPCHAGFVFNSQAKQLAFAQGKLNQGEPSKMFGNERREQEHAMQQAGRLPPGQSLTLKWPVLHDGTVPRFDPERWDFRVSGLVEKPVAIHLGRIQSPADEGSYWRTCTASRAGAASMCAGRAFRFQKWRSIAGVKPEAKYVMVLAEQGYTANVPLEDLMRPTTLFALKHNGEPLPADHGYPVRLVVPHLYAWKSVKWVRGIEFMAARRARLLGTKRLPHVRRPVQRAALQRAADAYAGARFF